MNAKAKAKAKITIFTTRFEILLSTAKNVADFRLFSTTCRINNDNNYGAEFEIKTFIHFVLYWGLILVTICRVTLKEFVERIQGTFDDFFAAFTKKYNCILKFM